jgi:hypothetical protein
MQTVDGLSPGADQFIAVLGEAAQGGDGFVDDRGVEASGGVRGDTDGQGVGLVGLRPCSVDNIRTRRASFAGTSPTSTPSAVVLAVSVAPRPVASSIAQTACDQLSGYRSTCTVRYA